MKSKTPERIEFLTDVLVGAVEGGTGYWAQAGGYTFDGDPAKRGVFLYEIDDFTDEVVWRVDLDTIAKGIGKITRGEAQINPQLQKLIAEASRENEAADLDAECADVIVQVAIFGEIVYG